jgi:hypothetical protein
MAMCAPVGFDGEQHDMRKKYVSFDGERLRIDGTISVLSGWRGEDLAHTECDLEVRIIIPESSRSDGPPMTASRNCELPLATLTGHSNVQPRFPQTGHSQGWPSS